MKISLPPTSATEAGRLNEGGSQLRRPLLSFRRAKSGRRKPIVDAQGSLGLPRLTQKHLTLMAAWREFFSFRPEAFNLLVETMGPNRRVCSSNPNMPMGGDQFRSEQFTVSHKAEPKRGHSKILKGPLTIRGDGKGPAPSIPICSRELFPLRYIKGCVAQLGHREFKLELGHKGLNTDSTLCGYWPN
jgi:hypothetical protein